ncbi:MAG: hypothetical protein NTX61_08690 [Bacteroidetes bacterium]|nr:hypothetical protein [Bacteroidota bacterium]
MRSGEIKTIQVDIFRETLQTIETSGPAWLFFNDILTTTDFSLFFYVTSYPIQYFVLLCLFVRVELTLQKFYQEKIVL